MKNTDTQNDTLLLNSANIKINMAGEIVKLQGKNGAVIQITKAELHQLCRNYLEAELYKVKKVNIGLS